MATSESSMLIESMVGDDGILLSVVQQFVAAQLRREQLAGNISDDLDVEIVAEMMVHASSKRSDVCTCNHENSLRRKPTHGFP